MLFPRGPCCAVLVRVMSCHVVLCYHFHLSQTFSFLRTFKAPPPCHKQRSVRRFRSLFFHQSSEYPTNLSPSMNSFIPSHSHSPSRLSAPATIRSRISNSTTPTRSTVQLGPCVSAMVPKGPYGWTGLVCGSTPVLA